MKMSIFQLTFCLVLLALAHDCLAVERYLPGAIELLTWSAMWDSAVLKLRSLIFLFKILIGPFHLSLLVLSYLS